MYQRIGPTLNPEISSLEALETLSTKSICAEKETEAHLSKVARDMAGRASVSWLCHPFLLLWLFHYSVLLPTFSLLPSRHPRGKTEPPENVRIQMKAVLETFINRWLKIKKTSGYVSSPVPWISHACVLQASVCFHWLLGFRWQGFSFLIVTDTNPWKALGWNITIWTLVDLFYIFLGETAYELKNKGMIYNYIRLCQSLCKV